MERRVKSREMRLVLKIQVLKVGRRFFKKTMPAGFQMAYNSVRAWMESRGLASVPSFLWPLIKTRVRCFVLCPLTSLGRYYPHAHLPLLINSPKSKAGEKHPTLHNLNHMGKRQCRAFTKNSNVQCVIRPLQRLHIPHELHQFLHFLSCHLGPSPTHIDFCFLQPT